MHGAYLRGTVALSIAVMASGAAGQPVSEPLPEASQSRVGQLLFIATVLGTTRLLFLAVANRVELRPAAILPAYLIGGISSYWVIERISNFWR